MAKALLVAIGFTPEGRKEVLGFEVADAETTESWTRFLAGLRRRGLSGVRLATTDAHEGLVAALQSVFPEVPWQRCQAHFARNVVDAAPKRLRVGLRGELAEMFNAKTMAEARRRRDEIAADYAGAAPRAVERLDAGFDDAMTVMELPEALRRVVRTSNDLEEAERGGEEEVVGGQGVPERGLDSEADRGRAHRGGRALGGRSQAVLTRRP